MSKGRNSRKGLAPVINIMTSTQMKAAADAIEPVEDEIVLPPVSEIDFTESEDVFQARIKAERIALLQEQVALIAGERSLGKVNFRFKTAGGGESGTNLQYYFDCKKYEIETGEPCNFVQPIFEVSNIQQSAKRNAGMPPLGAHNPVKKTGCANC